MAAISELCAALEACLHFFHSPSPDSVAARTCGERLQRRLVAAVRAAEASEFGDEARSRFCRLLGELGGAMAAVARSPAARAAYEPGARISLAQVVGGAQLTTACFAIKGCSGLAVMHNIPGSSDSFRWAQSWRLLAELGRRSVQSGLASASQASRVLHAGPVAAHVLHAGGPAAALLVGAATQIPLQAVLDTSLALLEAAQALLCMLRLPGNERTLAAFAGTIAASTDTMLLMAITSTALTLCVQQGVGPAAEPMRFFKWAYVCGALLADPPFAKVQALMQAQPHMQAAVLGLLLHALPIIWPGIKAAADAGSEGLIKATHFASRLLQIAAAPCLVDGMQQALGQCSGSSGQAAVEALAHVVGFAAQLGSFRRTEPGDMNYPAEAVCAWGQLCAALAQSSPGAGSPLQRHASRNSVMLLPALVELAAAALQESPAGGGQSDADAAAAAADRILSSLAAAAKCAAGDDALDQQARPLRSHSTANAATAALKMLHLAAERQAVAACAGGGSGALPGLSALVDAGAAAAVSCLGSIGMAYMVHMGELEQGAASEQVEHDTAHRLWLLHTTACRFLHHALGRPAALPRLLSDRYETGWEGFLATVGGLVWDLTAHLEMSQERYQEADEGEERTDMHHSCPLDARTMQAIAVAHAEAMSALLAAMESGSSNVPCEGQPAEALAWGVAEGITRAAVLAEVSIPGGPNVVLGSAAAMGTLCSALDRALRTADQAADQVVEGRAAREVTGREIWVAKHMATMSCVRAAAACPQLAATLIVRGLLGQLMEADMTPDKRGGTLPAFSADARTVRAIVMGMVKACQAAPGGSTQAAADATAGGMHSTASTESPQLDVPAAALAAAVAAMPEPPALDLTTFPTVAEMIQSKAAELTYFCDIVMPTIQPLGQALDAFFHSPEQQAAAQLAAAQAAAARSCAYLRCANMAATGGPAAGEQPGSKRCGGCRVVRYCDAACSTADWRAGHRRMCKQLAAAHLEEKQSAAAGAAAGAWEEE